MNTRSILFLAKKGDANCEQALTFCRRYGTVTVHCGRTGEALPEEARYWDGDLIVSYRSPWIVPACVLKRATAAINFHPGPPEYPGTGCLNFALYEEADFYGVTCHHMTERVDEGAIIHVDRFPIHHPEEGVASLLERSHLALLSQFCQVMDYWKRSGAFPESPERWSGRKRTRAELDALARITPEMSPEEVERRIRATSFGPWQPVVEIAGHTFALKR